MGLDTPFLILLIEFEDPRRVEDKQNRPPHMLFAISATISGSNTGGSIVSSMRISPACGSSLALNGTGLQHDPNHSRSVERGFCRAGIPPYCIKHHLDGFCDRYREWRQSVGGDASAQAARKKLFVSAIRPP
jgi:hypothetical protein